MKVAIQARLKNGILFEAAKKMGSQSALARHLGIPATELGEWVNFKRSAISLRSSRSPATWQEIENKLFELTGCTLEEIFPPEIRSAAFLKREKKIEAIVEMPVEQLMAAGAVPQLPPAPDELLFTKERSAMIERVLAGLSPRQRQVIKLRFGLSGEDEHPLTEVAAKMNVTSERVRQIEMKALKRLRAPKRARPLRRILAGDEQ